MSREEGGEVVGQVKPMSDTEYEHREQMIMSDEHPDLEMPGFAKRMLHQSLERERDHRDRHAGADIIECRCGKRFCQKCLDEKDAYGIHTCHA